MRPGIEIHETATETTISFKGSLDINSAPEAEEQFAGVFAKRPAKLVCDLSALDLIDSSGVATLVRLYKGVHNYGGTMNVQGARDQPLAILKLLRMDKVFHL